MKPVPSVLWRCWLGSRKGIWPVKAEWWGAGVVICLERVADLHMAQLMPLPLIVSCFSKIQIGFTFLVPAYPGSPGKRAVKYKNIGDYEAKNSIYLLCYSEINKLLVSLLRCVTDWYIKINMLCVKLFFRDAILLIHKAKNIKQICK